MNKINRRYLAVIVACVIGVLPLILRIPYLEPDDYLMNYIANGSYGAEGQWNLLYINPATGAVLCGLYRVVPAVNWYAVLLLGTVTVACILLHESIIDLTDDLCALVLSFMMNGIIMFFLTFSVVAYIAVASGTICILNETNKQIKRPMKFVLSAILICIGLTIRQNVFASCIALLIPFAIDTLARVKNMAPVKMYKQSVVAVLLDVAALCAFSENYPAKVLVIAVIVLLVGAVVLGWQNASLRMLMLTLHGLVISFAIFYAINLVATSTPAWQSYKTYNAARVSVTDVPIPAYETNSEEYQSIGMSENDFRMLQEWKYVDKSVFTQDLLHRVAALPREKVDVQTIIGHFTQKKVWVVFAFALGTAMLFCIGATGRARKNILVTLVILLGLFGALLLRQRMVQRVSVPLTLIFAWELMMLCLRERTRQPKWLGMVNVMYGITAFAVVLLGYGSFSKTQNPGLPKVRAYIKNNADTLYIIDSSLYNRIYYAGLSIIDVKPTNQFDNVIKTGGGDSFSSRYYAQLERFAVKQPDCLISSLVTETNIRYVTTDASHVFVFLQEHVGETTEIEENSFESDGVQIYGYLRN